MSNPFDLDFKSFTDAVSEQIKNLNNISKDSALYKVDVNRDELYDLYLNSYDEEYNPIYKERRVYDCNSCKSAIRSFGNVVSIDNNYNIHTIWDIEDSDIHPEFKKVARILSDYVRSKPIKNVFVGESEKIGTQVNRSQDDEGMVYTWNHFYGRLAKNNYITNSLKRNYYVSEFNGTLEAFKNGLKSITPESVEIVLDLINDNNLYRGESVKDTLTEFLKILKDYETHKNTLWIWKTVGYAHRNNKSLLLKIKNTSIGTLLVDISEGTPLDIAISKYEKIVAPSNYKRSKSVVTQKMVDAAKEKLQSLGLMSAMARRHATLNDLTPNDTLFLDGHTPQVKNNNDIFDVAEPNQTKPYGRVSEMPVYKFVSDVLPNTKSMKLLVENRHMGHLVSLVTAENEDSERLFQWNNKFSWSYVGDLTDSIKERVKSAGGNIDGDIRVSLSWFNTDDLDLHCEENVGGRKFHIYFGSKRSPITNARLDVDMNANGPLVTNPVENICYTSLSDVPNGSYAFYVHQFNKRNHNNDFETSGFDIELEIKDPDNPILKRYHYDKPMGQNNNIRVATLTVKNHKVVEILDHLPPSDRSITKWGVSSKSFVPVVAMTKSPNYWGTNKSGACHYFFFLQNCEAEGTVRGFYNEFLRGDLNEHRKVLEMVGSKVRATSADNQLSGIGFSMSRRENCTVEVTDTNGGTQNITINF